MRAPRRIGSALVVLILATTACTAPVTPAPTDPTRSATTPEGAAREPVRLTDVNCDGAVDVVFGSVTAQADHGVPWRAGSVTVRYGGTELVQVIDQVALGDERGETAGRFGGSVVTGDLNLDGCTDVVVGDAEAAAGSASPVWALWGSREGISADRSSRLLSGEDPGLGYQLAFVPLPTPVLVVGSEEGPRLYPVNEDGTLGQYRLLTVETQKARDSFSHNTFGDVLSASNDLLVVGAGEYSDEGYGYAGEVWVVRLLPGLDYHATRIAQDSPGVPDFYRMGDGFGASVSLFGGYVAIGVPGARATGKGSGEVQVFRVTGASGAPRVTYLTSIDAKSTGMPDARATRLFGASVAVYRPCDGAFGVLVQSGFTDDASSSATSVPFAGSGSCRTVVLAHSLTGWTPIGVLRRSMDGTSADTSLVVTTEQELRMAISNTTTGIPLEAAPFTVLAPPAA